MNDSGGEPDTQITQRDVDRFRRKSWVSFAVALVLFTIVGLIVLGVAGGVGFFALGFVSLLVADGLSQRYLWTVEGLASAKGRRRRG